MTAEIEWVARVERAKTETESVVFRARILYQDCKGPSHRYELMEDEDLASANPRHGWVAHKDLRDGSTLHQWSRKTNVGCIVIPRWLARKKGWV